MNTKLLERLEAHPELQKHMEAILDIVEDITGTVKKADDAEIRIVNHMRKMGAASLQEWAIQQEKTEVSQWSNKHPEAIGHGKKNFTGKPHLAD